MSDLVDRLTELLKENNMTLATAESCTGGMISATITHKPGASDIFERGFVTYSNQAKMEMLGVTDVVLSSFGAVSAETAQSMAKGAIENSNAGIAVSVTGIAGPDGGTDKKPVGLVYIGYALRGGSSGSVECNFSGSREQIRSATCIEAIKQLIAVLERDAS